MTSKHLFFKAMKEDLRHKTWMIALSVLANFLLLPVAWLVTRSNLEMYTSLEFYDSKYFWIQVIDFLVSYVSIGGGVIAIVGALIVGLFGFRFVFHRKMIDTYHSIPIKRSTLYGVCWLNGFLIWFVPFLICFFVTFVMAFSFMGSWIDSSMEPWITPWMLFQSAGVTVVVLTVVFFLVYHLVLTAVMVSGNVLNTLVSMMILGFGVIGIFSLAVGFCSFYMTTFYDGTVQMDPAIYLSPFMAAVVLLYQRVNTEYFDMTGLWMPIFIDAGMAVILGCAAWLLYKRRASELAEQGIRNKILSAALKILVSVAAGMGGWLIFMMLTLSNSAVGWGVFGALLFGILAFGVMDIIFSMDFKAFFSHKILMGISAALCLLICFSLYGDWYGYDTYLPDKEQIAEIAIADTNYTNRMLYYSYGNEMSWLNITSIQDVDAAYRYLEEMTGRVMRGYILPDEGTAYHAKRLATKVTLKNGKTYYRYYWVTDVDLELVWPLLSNRNYLETNYLVDEKWASRFDEMTLRREDHNRQSVEVERSTAIALTEAYNKDILENPATVLLHQGILLTRLELQSTVSYPSIYADDIPEVTRVILEVYDTMANTIKMLEQMGYGDWTAKKSADEVDEIRLYVYGGLNVYATAEQVMEDARTRYNVPCDDAGPEASVYLDVLAGNTMQTALTVVDDPAGGPYYVTDYEDQLFIRITDKAEIRELMELANYAQPSGSDNVFCKNYSPITIKDNEDSEYNYYIKGGELPEKYIYRFGEMFEYLQQQ